MTNTKSQNRRRRKHEHAAQRSSKKTCPKDMTWSQWTKKKKLEKFKKKKKKEREREKEKRAAEKVSNSRTAVADGAKDGELQDSGLQESESLINTAVLEPGQETASDVTGESVATTPDEDCASGSERSVSSSPEDQSDVNMDTNFEATASSLSEVGSSPGRQSLGDYKSESGSSMAIPASPSCVLESDSDLGPSSGRHLSASTVANDENSSSGRLQKWHIADLDASLAHVASECQEMSTQANATHGRIAKCPGSSLPPSAQWTENKHDAKCIEVALAAADANVQPEVTPTASANLEAHKQTQLSFAEESARADKAMFDAIDNCLGSDLEDIMSDPIDDEFGNINSKYEDQRIQLAQSSQKSRVGTRKTPLSQKSITRKEILDNESELRSLASDLALSVIRGDVKRIRHPRRGYWELHSSKFYDMWCKAGHKHGWEYPLLKVQHHIQHRKGDTVVSVGLLICDISLRSDSFHMLKYTSKLPILVSAREEGTKSDKGEFDMEIEFLGEGYLRLRIPELIAVQSIDGNVAEGAKLGLCDGVTFYGIQIID